MDRIQPEAVRLVRPGSANGFVGCEAAQGLEASGEVVGVQEDGEVAFELLVGLVVVAPDSGLLEGPVHSFDLAVGPGMVRLGEAMRDAVDSAGTVEGMAAPQGRWLVAVPGQVRELDAVVGQDCVDSIGYGGDELVEELSCGERRRLRLQAGEGIFRGPVHRDEQVQLAFLGPHFGDVDVEEAERIGPEDLSGGVVALDLGQPADPVSLQAAVQG